MRDDNYKGLPLFDGADIQPERDTMRLTGQLERIYNLMKDGRWRTLQGISEWTGDPAASVSAQLRNLRKKRFGAHVIERKHYRDGLYIYRIKND